MKFYVRVRNLFEAIKNFVKQIQDIVNHCGIRKISTVTISFKEILLIQRYCKLHENYYKIKVILTVKK